MKSNKNRPYQKVCFFLLIVFWHADRLLSYVPSLLRHSDLQVLWKIQHIRHPSLVPQAGGWIFCVGLFSKLFPPLQDHFSYVLVKEEYPFYLFLFSAALSAFLNSC
ncbi:hypothetical protein C883_3372 [Bacillus stratosphericus LAMA 585]|nr:hypothetical protein C883_3372 [Bacillus stratosphericus LAMA 585]